MTPSLPSSALLIGMGTIAFIGSPKPSPEETLHPVQRADGCARPRVKVEGSPRIRVRPHAYRPAEELRLGTPARLGGVGPHGKVEAWESGGDRVLDGLGGDGGGHAVPAPGGIVSCVVEVEALRKQEAQPARDW